jgi:hypothetical protein
VSDSTATEKEAASDRVVTTGDPGRSRPLELSVGPRYIRAVSDLQEAVEVIKRQRAVIDTREAELAKQDTLIVQLKGQIAELEKALCEQFGAHGVLIKQYCDPKLSDSARRQAAAAAIAYEKAKVPSVQERSHTFRL